MPLVSIFINFVYCVSLFFIILTLTNPTTEEGYKVSIVDTCCRRKPAEPELVWRPNDLYYIFESRQFDRHVPTCDHIRTCDTQ